MPRPHVPPLPAEALQKQNVTLGLGVAVKFVNNRRCRDENHKHGGYTMQWSNLTRWGLAALMTSSLIIIATAASAELKPGDKLDKTNCQEAKGLLPEHVMEKFCEGQYSAEIIDVKDDAFQYSKKFKEGSE